MKRPVFVQPRAQTDIQTAREWYLKIHFSLGQEFFEEAIRVAHLLENEAERLPLYFGEFRRIQFDRFPYKAFFLIRSGGIYIVRVLHAKRDHRRLLR